MNAKKTSLLLISTGILVAGLGLLAGLSAWVLTREMTRPETTTLMVLPEPRTIADFELTDQHGNPFTLDRVRGRWSLWFFGFTHCPDICPGTLYDLKTVQERLGAAARPQVLFVSVDPERDSPRQLGDYVAYFHPDFLGLTGPDLELAPLTRQLGVAYRIEPHEPGVLDYAVDHSASLFLTDPNGRLHGVFPAPHDPELIAADLAELLN